MTLMDERDILEQLKHAPDIKMSESSKERVLTNIKKVSCRVHAYNRLPWKQWITGAAAACAAVIIAGGLYTALQHDKQGQHTQTAGEKVSQQKFDYRHMLGFQPMLPAYMPKGFSLAYISVIPKKSIELGYVSTFSAIYRKGKAEYTIEESKATMSQTIPRGYQTEPVKINGIEGKSYQLDGYHVQFEKDGIVYHVSMDGIPLDYNSGQRILYIAAHLSVPATQKPNQIGDISDVGPTGTRTYRYEGNQSH
jgi:hypothetical protein